MANSLKQKREKLENFMTQNIKGFEIRSKEDSFLMKFLSYIIFFNKGFMTRFVTTFYPHVYVPKLPWNEDNNLGAIATLAHEWVHLYDRQRLGWFFNFLYLFPQCLFVLGLLGIWNPWFYFFFLFILPFPSPGRAWAEFRGYRMTIAAYYWMTGMRIDVKSVVDHFVNSNYYFMWPFRGWLMRKFQKECVKIQNDVLTAELTIVKNILRN
tara:strand:+ start:5273 stop:5902 length:630 start_codon:yes stop_codon:yes gene_type:complete